MSKKNKEVILEPLDENLGYLNMGCDPEFFFLNEKRQVIGSEKVLPEKGLRAEGNSYGYYDHDTDPLFVIDGVQAELHPYPDTCRALLGNDIRECFKTLRKI